MLKLLKLLSLASMLMLLISISASLIAPSCCMLIAMFGLAFPVLWIFNLIIAITTLLLRLKRLTLIIVFVLLATSPVMLKYYSLPLKGKPTPLKHSIISYNVFGFMVPGFESGQYKNIESIQSLINQQDFTIACFQEYPMKGAKHAKYHEKLMNGLNLPYKHFSEYKPLEKNTNYILVTASSFPVIATGSLEYLATKFAIYSDIAFPEDTIRIYNIHLQSIKFTKERKLLTFNDGLLISTSYLSHLNNAYNKLKTAFIHRENQSIILAESISKSPFRTIVAGDFNDTPVSYSYNKLSGNLKDASYMQTTGFNRTYKLSTFPLQIDFIMHDKSIFSSGYRQFILPVSDHKPVICDFQLDH